MGLHRGRPALVLSPRWRTACTVLAVVPWPGLGTLVAGWMNPHTDLRRHGVLQMLLVLFGSFPLVIPGAIGLAWAVWSAADIHRRARAPGPLSVPVDGPGKPTRPWWRRRPSEGDGATGEGRPQEPPGGPPTQQPGPQEPPGGPPTQRPGPKRRGQKGRGG